MSGRIAVSAFGLVSILAFSSPVQAQSSGDDSAAHALAEKFSGAAEKKAAEEKARALELRRAAARAAEVRAAEEVRRRAEESEMLARARREVAEREAALRREREAAEQEARARAEAEERQRQEAARVEAARLEAARLEAARLETERVQREAAAAEVRRLEDEKRADTERMAREAEERRQAEAQRALEAEREAEARRIAEKHNRLREEREAEAARHAGRASEGVNGPGDDSTPPAEYARSPEITTSEADGRPQDGVPQVHAPESRVTVLLVMEPGNRGIRRYGKTADPVLCSGPACWLSTGAGEPAMRVNRQSALGPGNTLGRRAWACSHSLGCVFRGVDIGPAGASVQPIDLRFLRHDRREIAAAKADPTCEIDAGRLTCGEPIETRTWRAWIVPESLAAEAGARLLGEALAGGLSHSPRASWGR